jgi:hypothetical protein
VRVGSWVRSDRNRRCAIPNQSICDFVRVSSGFLDEASLEARCVRHCRRLHRDRLGNAGAGAARRAHLLGYTCAELTDWCRSCYWLQVRFLIRYAVCLALPKSHPHANKASDFFIAAERRAFYRAKSYVPELRGMDLECLPARGSQRIVKEADGVASALAFCHGGFWGGRGQQAAAEDPGQECAFPGSCA